MNIGAGRVFRNLDLPVKSRLLLPLSYTREISWLCWMGTIHRPRPYEGRALPLSYSTTRVNVKPLVPEARLERARPCGQLLLRQPRLPVPPRGDSEKDRRMGCMNRIELSSAGSQPAALPLSYTHR